METNVSRLFRFLSFLISCAQARKVRSWYLACVPIASKEEVALHLSGEVFNIRLLGKDVSSAIKSRKMLSGLQLVHQADAIAMAPNFQSHPFCIPWLTHPGRVAFGGGKQRFGEAGASFS